MFAVFSELTMNNNNNSNKNNKCRRKEKKNKREIEEEKEKKPRCDHTFGGLGYKYIQEKQQQQ